MNVNCQFCDSREGEEHHKHCPTLAGPGEKETWERGYKNGRIGKPYGGYGPHYNLGYIRGKAELDAAVADQPPGW